MKIQLNAFDRDSSQSYSQTIEVNTMSKLTQAIFNFESNCPFVRFYYDNEILDLIGGCSQMITRVENL